VRRLPPLAALALVVLGGCGGGGDSGAKVPDDVAARGQLAAYLAAFYRGDGKAACALLTSRAQTGLRGESLRIKPPDCAGAIRELASTSRRLHSPKIGVRVSGDRASATVRAARPAYQSGALLQKQNGKWLIAYPPGLLQKYVGKGGVKPGASLDTPSG
jgi:hypothetical protein